MYTKIDGKAVAAKIKDECALKAEELKARGKEPGLAVIIVGNNPASRVYVNSKERDCKEVGINSYEYALPETTTTDELLELIEKLNNDVRADGILCQLPAPKQIDEKKVLNLISPEKDVDGFHPVNVGRLVTGEKGFVPCTPAGIIEMLKYYSIDADGKNSVIIGRSNIVGKPMAALMLKENATVTVCHSHTKNLADITRNADILIAAVGKTKFVKADMIKDGAVVIDVGMDRDENGKLCGDVDFENVAPKCSYITPVPGGVGPMTRAMLLKNTLTAAKNFMSVK